MELCPVPKVPKGSLRGNIGIHAGKNTYFTIPNPVSHEPSNIPATDNLNHRDY